MPDSREITLIYANLQSGLDAGGRLDLLPDILEAAPVSEPPALLMFCEGRWWERGGRARFEVARILRRLYGVHYSVEIGSIPRSDDPPALAVRSDLFAWHRWNTPHNDHHVYSHNSALLAWQDKPEEVAVQVQIAHLDYASGTRRMAEAEALASQMKPSLVNILAGDFNSPPSGPHCGSREWDAVPSHKVNQKARLIEEKGALRWVEDTRALDVLMGVWSEQDDARSHGAGYSALAEIDWRQRGRKGSLVGTTTTPQSLPIDHILVNWPVGLVSGSYSVHFNDHSDHALLHARIKVPFV